MRHRSRSRRECRSRRHDLGGGKLAHPKSTIVAGWVITLYIITPVVLALYALLR